MTYGIAMWKTGSLSLRDSEPSRELRLIHEEVQHSLVH